MCWTAVWESCHLGGSCSGPLSLHRAQSFRWPAAYGRWRAMSRDCSWKFCDSYSTTQDVSLNYCFRFNLMAFPHLPCAHLFVCWLICYCHSLIFKKGEWWESGRKIFMPIFIWRQLQSPSHDYNALLLQSVLWQPFLPPKSWPGPICEVVFLRHFLFFLLAVSRPELISNFEMTVCLCWWICWHPRPICFSGNMPSWS